MIKRLSTIPLTEIKQGSKCTVTGLKGTENYCLRLTELGFIPGSEVLILQNSAGKMLVRVGATRLSITDKMAEQILVR